MKQTSARFLAGIALGFVVLAPAFGQTAPFRARMVGGGSPGSGKCTVEVDVDSAVEIEIRGDQGRLRTVAGSPGAWRRMECTGPVPENPREFSFHGVDGRGSQVLLRQPQDNHGAALIRIDDPQGGREGYTFDIEWRDTAPIPPPPPVRRDGGRDGDRRDGDRRDGGIVWNDQMNFQGRGDGYFRNFRGQDDILGNCQVTINRRGEVQVAFDTNHRSRLILTGKLTHADRDHLIADVSGNGLAGSMEIITAGRDRVVEVNMSELGRDRFEIHWRR